LIWNDPSVKAWDMQDLAKAYIEKNDGGSEKSIRVQSNQFWDLVLIYENTELDTPLGLLKKEKLLKIKEAEKVVINDP